MLKILTLLIVLAFTCGMAFAGGDGFCSYQQQAKQVAAEKSDAAKSQADQTAATSETKSETDQFVLALDSANTRTPAEPQKK